MISSCNPTETISCMLPFQLILATTKNQIMYLDRLHSDLQEPVLNDPSYSPSTQGVPTYFLSPQESWRMEPDLGPNVLCSMLSTESGIVDSHALMQSLEAEIVEEREGEGSGSLGLGTKVVRIDPYTGENG
jgi:2-hydroxyglutarate dehydrogenase